MINKILTICIAVIAVLSAKAIAGESELEARVKALLLEIDFSRDGQKDPTSVAARTELNAINRGEAVDALVTIHNNSDVTGKTAGEAMRSSSLRASTINMLDSWGYGTTKALNLARTDLKNVARLLLSRNDTDDLNVAPFEIESVLRILVYYGTSQDVESINSASEALSKHKTTLSGIWAQSIQSDLEMLQREKRLNQVGVASPPLRGSETKLNLGPDSKISSKASNLARSIPSDETVTSTPWSVIVVLIVAATGLLWLLVKRRS